MSTDIYFWNKNRKEYVHGFGNHNYNDTLRYNWPKLFVWLMMNDWINENIKCIRDYDDDIYALFSHTNKTIFHIKKWNKSIEEKEHGKMVENKNII